jgi:hypothetical protein
MNRPSEAAITITEAAYDLQVTETDWFPRVIDATVPLISIMASAWQAWSERSRGIAGPARSQRCT